ncbi:alpha/beta fold hydrolase [Nocardiopsis aegyptia]|uniref:Pimeloyl-ACP methyl ester carboxylesterase n=1 Tax=Nocardiopsis aegyptia TaxID=220378 RepID=A0A7Z0ER59_9ACTN|nr:alpha/beta hydrolase [Nocardiopsis aegyptia]NYJ36758.1 pimeloyl-ACP methyl ester carboxylesterase [Nocardiopsis aegyptia]
MHQPETGVLEVPGARIHYEVRGSGPLLLMIPGGPQDAGVLAAPARLLSHRYTTVAYDPRGNSRSALDGEPGDQDVELHAEDAARLVAELGGGPARVFGTSGGAQIGLALAALRPDLVHTVVAHEPPCLMLLEDPSHALAQDQEVYDTYVRDGVEAAIARFLGMHGLDSDDPHHPQAPDGAEAPRDSAGSQGNGRDVDGTGAAATFARVSGNFDYFFGHGLRPLSRYVPDTAALATGAPRVVVALGRESVGQTIHGIGLALAAALATDPADFPGDHGGFESHPEDFALALERALGD